jgi:hypothetical protein
VKRFSFGLLVVIVSWALFAGSPAWSEGERRFSVKVTVAEISNAEGKIDERAKRLDLNLRKKFKYNSLRVIKERRLTLELEERGLLMAVGWEGEVMMDMRAPNNHLLVIGGPTHGDGQLVVSIEPHYQGD